MRAVLLVLVLLIACRGLQAQAKGEKAAKPKEAVAVTPEREAAVFTFVEQHHPELGDLLTHLKESNETRQYQRAIRDLSNASERLAAMQKNDAERYELELQAWKAKSRIQLLAAKLTMNESEELRDELKASLADQYEIRRDLLKLERERFRDKLRKAEKALADHEARREVALERQYQSILSTGTPAKNAPARNKAKAKSERTVSSPEKGKSKSEKRTKENAAKR
jgi:hypothetical protein